MPDPIHVAITRRVKPGCEEEFAERLRAFVERSLAAPGALAVYCLSPAPGGTDYGILRSFASAEAKHAFYASALYQEWLEEVAPLVEGAPQIRDLHGLEAFFGETMNQPASGNSSPPRWKMAVLTWLGVCPTVAVWVVLFRDSLGLSFLGDLLVSNLFVVGTLTWVTMPTITRLFRSWLRA